MILRSVRMLLIVLAAMVLTSCLSLVGNQPIPAPFATLAPHELALTPENIPQAVELERLGEGRLTHVAWSGDSRTLHLFTAIGIYDFSAHSLALRQFHPLSLGTGKLVLDTQQDLAAAIVHTGTVETPALGMWDTVRLFDIKAGRAIHDLTGMWAFDFAFSPNGHLLAASGERPDGQQGLALVWDTNDGSLVARLEEDTDARVRKVLFSPDGRLLATLVGTGFKLWNLETGRVVLGARSTGDDIAFSADGEILHVGAGRWEVAGGEPLTPVDEASFWDGARSSDGRWKAAIRSEWIEASTKISESVNLWDLSTGQRVWTAPISGWTARTLKFSPDDRLLVISAHDSVTVWDVKAKQKLGVLDWPSEPVESLAVSPTAETVSWAQVYGAVQIWDLRSGERLRILPGDFQAVAYSPSGRLASCGRDMLAVWDGTGSEKLREMAGQRYPCGGLAFSPDGRWLVGTNDAHDVTVWSMKTGRQRYPIRGHTSSVVDAAFSQDGTFFATASNDATVRTWDAESLGAIHTFTTMDGSLYMAHSVAISPDSRTVAGGTSDGLVWLWDARSGDLVRQLAGHLTKVRGLAFSPDGQLLASAGDDGLIYVWDPVSGRALHTFRGHASGVTALSFTADGRWLLSAGYDGTVRMWGLEE